MNNAPFPAISSQVTTLIRRLYFHKVIGMGSSSKMKRRGSLSLVHGVVLAATAAALAAVMTMLGAAFSFLDRSNDDLETLISSSTGRIVSHTLRSTSVQTSVGCSDKGTTRTTGMTILDAHNQHQDHIYEVDKKVHTTTQEVKASDTENMYAPASTINAIEVTDKSDKGLRVAWLMSFPNSGTSYTIHLVRQASNATTATNYALEGDIKDAVSIPAIPGRTNGPFLELIPTIETNLPPKYILTKTHCGGFCSNCLPTNYIETPRSFQISCLSGRSAVRSSNSTGLVIEQVHYSSDLVKKAVHLIRDPFSNIVARFHLERKRHTRWNNTEWLEEHPNDRYGFQKWCTDVDASDELVEARWVDSDLSAALKAGVPCHAEFFRYVILFRICFVHQ